MSEAPVDNWIAVASECEADSGGAWDKEIQSAPEHTVLRINWLVRRHSGFLVCKKRFDATPSRPHVYTDDWTFLCNDVTREEFAKYYAVPANTEYLLEGEMDGLSFTLNSSFIYGTIRRVLLSPHASYVAPGDSRYPPMRYEKQVLTGWGYLNLYLLFDFGETEVKTELNEWTTPTFEWKGDLSSMPLLDRDTALASAALFD